MSLFLQFVPILWILDTAWSKEVIKTLVNSFLAILFMVIFAMLITYVTTIRSRLTRLIAENLKLLDKMHEGLILIQQDDFEVQFASEPAASII